MRFVDKFIHFIRKFKIRARIAAFLMLFTIVPSVIVFSFSNFFATQIIQYYLNDYIASTQQQVESGINLIVDQVNTLSLSLLSNHDIYNLIDDPSISEGEKEAQFKVLIENFIVHKELIADVVIVTNDNRIFRYADKDQMLDSPDWNYIRRVRDSNMPLWGNIKKDIDNNAYVMLGRRFQNFHTGYRLGSLIIYIRERAIHNTYKNLVVDQSYSFIISNDSYIISHPDQEKAGGLFFDKNLFKSNQDLKFHLVKYDNETYIIANYLLRGKSENMPRDWKVISMISYKNLFDILAILNKYVAILRVVIIALLIGLSIYISNKLIGSITRLKRKMDLFAAGNMNIHLFRKDPNDEIWILEKSFNDMVTQIKDLIRKNNEEKEKQREAELRVLQAQINPHFIYNALDSISWIAKMRNQKDIEEMILALASFFRISLHKGDKFITIREEIEHVKSYVTIQQMRFPKHFDVDYNVAEDILDYRIVKIILQPFVENAIKHGIAENDEKGLIRVIGYKMGNEIRFEIIDNGIGFDVESLKYRFENERNRDDVGGYGIQNVQERITLQYGLGYGLHFYSKPGKGTRVEIHVPFEAAVNMEKIEEMQIL